MSRERSGLFGSLGPQRRELKKLEKRIDRLEEELHECRQMNRRLAEIADVVQQVLVPAANRDDERLRELLDEYQKGL